MMGCSRIDMFGIGLARVLDEYESRFGPRIGKKPTDQQFESGGTAQV
jgi:hypothetical protein